MEPRIHLAEALILLTVFAFAIESFVSLVIKIISWDPSSTRARVLNVSLSAALAVLLCFVCGVQILEGVKELQSLIKDPWLITRERLYQVLTVLLIVAGSDRISALKEQVATAAGAGDTKGEAISIKLTLDDKLLKMIRESQTEGGGEQSVEKADRTDSATA